LRASVGHTNVATALSPAAGLTPELRQLGDNDLHASLAVLGSAGASDGQATVEQTPHGQTAGTRYHVLRPHAKEGLGEVFVALDGELQREVALKEIDDEHAASASSRRWFIQEAEITGKLEHPGVVPVYGLGQHADGLPSMLLLNYPTLVMDQTAVGKEVVDSFRDANLSAQAEAVVVTGGHDIMTGEDGAWHVPKKGLCCSMAFTLDNHMIRLYLPSFRGSFSLRVCSPVQ
jgi:hypothetical protein